MSEEVQTDPGVVIVGAGQAGCEAAFALRAAGHTGPIDLIGREPWPPYRRPPLSKQFIASDSAPESLSIKPAPAFAKAGITLRTATEVVAIDRPAQTVRFADGGTLPYRHLVLATGGTARRLDLPGSTLRGIHALRGIDDALAIRGGFHPGRRLVVVGGGFIGLEVAALAIQHGMSVSVLEAAPRLLSRVTAPMMSGFYEHVHRGAGVEVQLGACVDGFVGEDRDLTGVRCGNHLLPADMALVGVGLHVADEVAAAAGLRVDNGILTDAQCRTDDPDIYAIGDCARSWRAASSLHLRLESVPNAIEQGRMVAQLIAGLPAPEPQAPWFWSDQYDLKLQMVGLSAGHDQEVLRGQIESRAFMVFYLREGALIACDAVNRVADFNIARKLVTEARRIDPAVLADEGLPLKDLAIA